MTVSHRALVFGNCAAIGFGVVCLALVVWTDSNQPFTTFFAGSCAGTGVLGLSMSKAHGMFWKAAQRQFAFDMVCMEQTARMRLYNGAKQAFTKLREEGIVTDALTPEEFLMAVDERLRMSIVSRGGKDDGNR